MDIVTALKFGLSGACVVLAHFGLTILRDEQSRPGPPRKAILRSIYIYWSLCACMALLLFGAEYLRIQSDQKVTYYEGVLEKLRGQMDQKFIHEVNTATSPTIKPTYEAISKTLDEARTKFHPKP